jgi:hypothetical protein
MLSLGRELRTLYGDLIEEGVPDHLAPFVEQLEVQRNGQEG